MKLAPADLAYAAALIDSFAVLTTRRVGEAELPQVTIQGKVAALPWLAEVSGVKVIEVAKDYARHQCSEHCPDRHTRIESTTRRWQLTGARATVVLYSVEPYLRVQARTARGLVEVGQGLGFKTDVVNDMTRLGWTIPELRSQPRARIERVSA